MYTYTQRYVNERTKQINKHESEVRTNDYGTYTYAFDCNKNNKSNEWY